MPCFHGLAVSIHTPDGPLPEYSIQKQSRYHRITSYIPVPPPKVPEDSSSGKPRQSTFAISITLLTPGRSVPYSTPRPTPEDPYPSPKIVGPLPGFGGGGLSQGGKSNSAIGPYIPLTSSPIETVAAYIYFDGRAKEEVATLLRRGEETWVNSRWVSVPESEGGGLAEREFLFREVGLERWLNGLDLEGKDIQARIERRKKRLERKRRKKAEAKGSDDDDDDNDTSNKYGTSFGELLDRLRKPVDRHGVLRYGENESAPVESLSGDESLFTSNSDSDDEPPEPEAAGQIKIALFRVLASGEVRRGEYSPQFDAHDDDDATEQNGSAGSNAGGSGGGGVGGGGSGGGGGDGDVDHTTSFAKPKTLDPKKISTQTVTTIDMPDKPYAVFTFLYRGERQLRKMGILPPLPESKKPTPARRKGNQIDFSNLAPLNPAGTKNFSGYREASSFPRAKKGSVAKGGSNKKTDGDNDDAMDSDADDDDDGIDERNSQMQADDAEGDMKDEPKGMLSPEDAARQGELAEGVRKIKLKRQHSAEPLSNSPRAARKSSASASASTSNATSDPNHSNAATSTSTATSATTAANSTTSVPSNPAFFSSTSPQVAEGSKSNSKNSNDNKMSDPMSNSNDKPMNMSPDRDTKTSEPVVGSPFKKQRASLPGFEESIMRPGTGSVSGFGGGDGGKIGGGDVVGGNAAGGFGGPLGSIAGGGGGSSGTMGPENGEGQGMATETMGAGKLDGLAVGVPGGASGSAGAGAGAGPGLGGSGLGVDIGGSSSSGVAGKASGGNGISRGAGATTASTTAMPAKAEDDEEL